MTTPVIAMLAAGALAADAAPEIKTAVIAVAELPGPTPTLVDLANQVRDALAARRKGVLAAAEVRSRMRFGADAVSLPDLDTQYRAAVVAMQESDYAAASKALQTVVHGLERAFGLEGTFARWTRARLRLARVERLMGRGPEATRHLERLVRADPAVFVDPDLYPPSFQAEVEKVRAAVGAMPLHTLSVTAGGRPARVFVDGRDVGQAPVSVTLRAGAYAVNAALGKIWIPPVEVDLRSASQKLALDLSLAEMVRPELGPAVAAASSDRAFHVSTLGRHLEVDEVVVVWLESERNEQYLVADLQDVHTAIVYRAGSLRIAHGQPPPGGVAALVALLASGESSPLVELGLVALTVDQPRPRLPPPGSSAGPRKPGVRVLLKHGGVFRGEVVRRTERMLVISTFGGGVREIPLSEVSAIDSE
jgi:hypothetical protein